MTLKELREIVDATRHIPEETDVSICLSDKHTADSKNHDLTLRSFDVDYEIRDDGDFDVFLTISCFSDNM